MPVTRRQISAEDYESMPTEAEFVASDPAAPPEYSERNVPDIGTAGSPTAEYTSDAHFAREVEQLWRRVWQSACREAEIPDAGDFFEYRINNESIIIVRRPDGSVGAFHNACTHRGTALIEGTGNTSGKFRCSFHGWTFDLDGNLTEIPCRWDFAHVNPAGRGLRPCLVDTWNGFVFVNMDLTAGPLEDFLGEQLTRHWRRWPLDERVKVVHVSKRIECNWKVALEAFMEVYHVFRTHPEMVYFAGDACSQYDVIGDLHGRKITPNGIQSPHLSIALDDQDIVDAFVGLGVRGETESVYSVADFGDARTTLAGHRREILDREARMDASDLGTVELIDSTEYFVFPNLFIWSGFSYPIVYRVKPEPDDPHACTFEIMIVQPAAASRAPDNPEVRLAPDAPWSECAEIGGLGPVFDQDMHNLPKVQRGLRSSGLDTVEFGAYQEMNIRNFHQNVASYLSGTR